jgi:hypothetical protein
VNDERQSRLREKEEGVLRRNFGTKREKVTEVWKKLHYEELRNL